MVSTSGTTTEQNDIKKKGNRTKCVKNAEQKKGKRTKSVKNAEQKKGKKTKYVKIAENGGFNMFMTKDYMVRYYQTHPGANEGLVTWETATAGFRAGCEEWFNMNDTKKTEWMEDYNNMIAEGKSLFILREEYRHLYIH